MSDLLDSPLEPEVGQEVNWQTFQRLFAIARDCLRNNDLKDEHVEKAKYIVQLCRTAIGGYAAKADFNAVQDVIKLFNVDADLILRRGHFDSAIESDIIEYVGPSHKELLQREFLPLLVTQCEARPHGTGQSVADAEKEGPIQADETGPDRAESERECLDEQLGQVAGTELGGHTFGKIGAEHTRAYGVFSSIMWTAPYQYVRSQIWGNLEEEHLVTERCTHTNLQILRSALTENGPGK